MRAGISAGFDPGEELLLQDIPGFHRTVPGKTNSYGGSQGPGCPDPSTSPAGGCHAQPWPRVPADRPSSAMCHVLLTHCPSTVARPSALSAEFDLADYFDNPVEPTNRPARPTARPFPRPGKPDSGFWDVIHTTTTKRPKTTQSPRKQNPGKNPSDLDLADALGDWDDARDGRRPAVRPEEGFSDSDLEGIVNDGYSPDKKKGSGGNTDSQDNRVETGTIAGIASALAMALVGAVSSYISYQQKKFCFSIQQGLNAEYVKGENMEAVVSEEPQVKYSVLETQSAEPPKHDGAKV